MTRKHDVDDELEFHIEMQTRRYEAAGLDRDQAGARARARLGNLQATREACRVISTGMEGNVGRTAWWQGIGQDIRYAVRVLRRTPTFTVTALVTLAIGLGANTAIFSVVNAVLLKTVPYAHPDRLMMIWNSAGTPEHFAVAAPEFADMVAQQRAFDGLAAIRPQPSSLAGACGSDAACEPERVQAYVVSPNLFDLLGTAPARGRGFTAADGGVEADKVVLISDGLWRRRFGADPAIVGRAIEVAAIRRTVIGVMPPGVRFPDAPVGFLHVPADVWIPFSYEQRPGLERGNQNLAVLGVLRPDAPVERGQQDLDAIAETFRARFPNRYAGAGRHWRLELTSLREEIAGDARPALLVLVGVVGIVLLIACANVANLLLARGSARRREMAVRNALGADRRRLVRQLLVEAIVLVAGGTALGLALAAAAVKALASLDPGTIPLVGTVRLDGTVMAFSVLIALVTAVLIGLLPALRQARVDPQPALGEGGRSSVGATRQRLRRALVAAEVALAVVVLVGAGLLIRSFVAMTRVPLGYDPSGNVAVQITVPGVTYDTDPKIVAFDRALVDRLRAVPGVSAVAAGSILPAGGSGWSGSLYIEGQPVPDGQAEPHAAYSAILPGYLSVMRIPLVEGREFDARDGLGAPPVAVIDELVARRHWPGQSAVGKRISPFGQPAHDAWTTVVGVARHVHALGPRVDSEPIVYLPASQQPQRTLDFVLRTAGGDPSAVATSIRDAVRSIDPLLPVTRIATLDDLTSKTTAPDRFNALLVALFGGIALVLAGVGLSGVIAYLVMQRTREIGIRLALGGRPGRVLAAVITEGLAMSAAGLVVGLAAALVLSRVLAGLVFGVEPTDPLTYLAISGLLLLVAGLASYLPARRVLGVDPVSVLRE